ncbi:phage portal protein [Spirochaeta africana]|uniref:Phage portal protein, HK97 family n=1 Tax=Spirochaeta africana (strain ATCC 700263 / DSM 8902 / Z-7692) TaxID=889378 RepID=H9UJE4_SPIAZ|nr:phage portal protein [Spirochaeta africana]AFG37637.1 phage portal protein, HK97 family [Spirochaeta africana DSM 8902]
MGLFSRRSKKISGAEIRAKLTDVIHTDSGVIISGSSQSNAIATQCVNLIAGSIASMPVELYFSTNTGGKVQAFDKPLRTLLKYQPNPDETPFTFYERIVRHLLDDGNAYLYRDNNGDTVRALYPLDPRKMHVDRDKNQRKIYTYDGTSIPSRNILHIPGRGYNGLKGVGVRQTARQHLELAGKMDKYAADAFDTGLTKRPVIDISEMYSDADPDDVKQIADYLRKNYSGSNKPFITFNGMKVQQLDSVDNRTAQLAENREYQTKIIASLYNVPVQMLNQGAAANVNLEVQNTNFLTYTLLPWIKIIEQYLRLLMTPFERERHFPEFNTAGLLRGDFETRMRGYATGIQHGILNHDQIAKLENQPALGTDAGRTFFVPANLMPLKDEVIDAYMAGAKQKAQQLTDQDTHGVGDDRK